MKYVFFSLILTLLLFQGCTAKNELPLQANLHEKTLNTDQTAIHTNTIKNCTTCKDNTNEFEDEFGDETENIIDPLSGYNRVMTSFNDKAIVYVLNPVSEAYATILPQPLRIGISNFLHNIQFPIRLTNNILQGKFQNSSDELERFIVNSTVGLGGLMDPAETYMNIPAHDEDFGQTLGHYGIGSGFHIVLPFFGPSNVRDLVGLSVDGYASPTVYIENIEKYKIPNNIDQSIGILSAEFVNKNSLHLGEYESLKKDAIDLYPFLRDTYEQKRVTQIAE